MWVMVKEVPTGTEVGYGGTFVTKRPTKIATCRLDCGWIPERSVEPRKGADPWTGSTDHRKSLYGSVYGRCDRYPGCTEKRSGDATWRRPFPSSGWQICFRQMSMRLYAISPSVYRVSILIPHRNHKFVVEEESYAQETRVRNASRNVVFGMIFERLSDTASIYHAYSNYVLHGRWISRLKQLVWFGAVGVEPCGVGRWFSDGLFHVPADYRQ